MEISVDKIEYYNLVSKVDMYEIGMKNLQNIIRKLMWREELASEEKDIVVTILSKKEEKENEEEN
ncbi:MAG TPA: hypothetical protein DEA28_02980 [Firmicutes bacterium]|nr:hypothetical protein [Bacillota bacterium]